MRTVLLLAAAVILASPAGAVTPAPSKPAAPEVKAPEGTDPKKTSTDPEYGYSLKKPVKVGGRDELEGPTAERTYLSTLRDEAGKPVAFERIGSFVGGADGNMLDGYKIRTSTGRRLTIYIDMYHPKNDPKQQLAPQGLFKAG